MVSALPSHLELVQGVVLPKPVGMNPVLDFCNTRSDWTGRRPARREWLTSYQALAVWAGYVGLLPEHTVLSLMDQAAADPAEASRRYEEAREFRMDLYDVLTEATAADAFAATAAVVERALARRRLAAVPFGQGLAASWESPEDLGLPLDRVSLLSADLLAGDDRRHVRACPGEHCGWLFLDPRGRRRWCSMSTCGNRAKVRAHAARTR